MFDYKKDYNLKMDQLHKLIRSRKTFDLAIELALEIHAATHTQVVFLPAKPRHFVMTYCRG